MRVSAVAGGFVYGPDGVRDQGGGFALQLMPGVVGDKQRAAKVCRISALPGTPHVLYSRVRWWVHAIPPSVGTRHDQRRHGGEDGFEGFGVSADGVDFGAVGFVAVDDASGVGVQVHRRDAAVKEHEPSGAFRLPGRVLAGDESTERMSDDHRGAGDAAHGEEVREFVGEPALAMAVVFGPTRAA
jgi:hypothetical protein